MSISKKKKKDRIKELETKLKKYQEKLAEKSLGYGQVVRTGYGDSFEDQLRDDTNALRGIIQSIREEIKFIEE